MCIRDSITIGVCFVPFAGPTFVLHGFNNTVTLQIINPFVQRLMRVGFADQDEFKSFRQQRPTKWLVTVQIIAEHRSAQRGVLATPAFQPAQRGVDLAILFVMAVLWPYKFWSQWNDLVAPGLNQNRCDYRVRIADFAVVMSFTRTAGTLELL